MYERIAPAYRQLLSTPSESPPSSPPLPTTDITEFLTLLARRMGMIKRGAEPDLERAATYFVRWWRTEGGLLAATSPFPAESVADPPAGPTTIQGWGFDFEWEIGPGTSSIYTSSPSTPPESVPPLLSSPLAPSTSLSPATAEFVRGKMARCIEAFKEKQDREEEEGGNLSKTQAKKMEMEELKRRRMKKRTLN